MSERAAWFCPSCQKHHAPHVDTCPGPILASGPPTFVSYPQPTTASPSTGNPPLATTWGLPFATGSVRSDLSMQPRN